MRTFIAIALTVLLAACAQAPTGVEANPSGSTTTRVEGHIQIADPTNYDAYALGPSFFQDQVAYAGAFSPDGTFAFDLTPEPNMHTLWSCDDPAAADGAFIGAVIAADGALPADSSDPYPAIHVANLMGTSNGVDYAVVWLYSAADQVVNAECVGAQDAPLSLASGWQTGVYYIYPGGSVLELGPIPSEATWVTTLDVAMLGDGTFVQ